MENSEKGEEKMKKIECSCKKRLPVVIILIVVLLLGNIYFFKKYSNTKKELGQIKPEIIHESDKDVNIAILDFFKFFIGKVLESEGEVDFETRLDLENAVRDLHDEEILEQWKKFTTSENEEGSQEEVRNLMKLLISKIRIS